MNVQKPASFYGGANSSLHEIAASPPDLAPIYVPLNESAKWFGVSRDTIYRARKRGHLKIYKAGSRSVLKVSEVKYWIEHR